MRSPGYFLNTLMPLPSHGPWAILLIHWTLALAGLVQDVKVVCLVNLVSVGKEHDAICLSQSFCLKYSWLKINTETRLEEKGLKEKEHVASHFGLVVVWELILLYVNLRSLLACAIEATSHIFVCLLLPVCLVLMMVQDTAKARDSCLDSSYPV